MSYQTTDRLEGVALVPPVSVDREERGVEIAFNRAAGYNFLCVVPSVILPCCAPLFSLVARKNMENQKCTVTDRRVVFESGWLNHSHKSIPLDRIQDVNVRQDCVQACFNVKSIEIQTAGAGGGIEPEATLIAPADAMMVRDVIMDRRDALVLGHPELMEKPRRRNEPSDQSAVVEELRAIRATLSRLEAQVETGVGHLAKEKQEP